MSVLKDTSQMVMELSPYQGLYEAIIPQEIPENLSCAFCPDRSLDLRAVKIFPTNCVSVIG